MQLPESLHPWRQWLEWFAPEHLPVFADLLGRLNPILGPLRGLQQGGVPEPDGLGDIQRRGPYDRLLSSEWLMAEEMPEEFLRRAAVGEHLFLAPQYRARQANRMIVLLLDAGPLQLGAARLVHLALMMLLARRALEAGAEFRWGILQSAPGLSQLDGPAHLKRLLHSRTYEVANDEHWQGWRAWLAEQPAEIGECWIVGQRLPKTERPSCTHRVQVHRSLDGQSLSFELQSSGMRRMLLPMPDERQALQLLKGHFEGEVIQAPAVKSRVPRVSLTSLPVIASAGTHIALKMLDEPGMVVLRLPAAQQKKPLEVRRQLWSSGRTPLSVIFMHNTLGAVLSDQSQLSFWNMPGLASVDRPEPEVLKLPPGTATFVPVAWLRNAITGRLFLLDTQGHLAFWAIATPRSPAKPTSGKTYHLCKNVIGLAKVDKERVAYVRSEAGRLCAHSVDPEGVVSPAHVVGVAEGVSQVLFAGGSRWRWAFGGCALLTVESTGERWQLVPSFDSSAPAQTIRMAQGWKGLGLWSWQQTDHCSLVALSPNQQAIALYGGDEQRVLFTTADAISRVSFCPMSGLVAALTSTRELFVYSIPEQALRLQVFCNEKPAQSQESGNA